MKSLFASKTFWVNLVSGSVMFLTGSDTLAIIPPAAVPFVAAFVFALNIGLRMVTTEPVSLTGN